MRTIRLYGDLGKQFGRVHRFAVQTPGEAIRALCVNFPGFDLAFANPAYGYRVINGSAALSSADEVNDPASGSMKIIPVIGGANAEARILVGAALIAASFFIPGGGFLAAAAFNVGASLALSGVSSLLSPVPKTDSPEERPENKPSKYFNGPVNTVAQGQPVPVLYGELIVGSALISAGIEVDRLDTVKLQTVDVEGIEDQVPSTVRPGYFKREFVSSVVRPFNTIGGAVINVTYKTYRYFYAE